MSQVTKLQTEWGDGAPTEKLSCAFLFRALRPEEINAGCVLLPKVRTPFKSGLRLPTVLPVVFGDRVEHAVRDHQWCGKYQTCGASTTPHLDRARYYAHTHRVIVKISTAMLAEHTIKAYSVKDQVPIALIVKPEDDEVILVCEDGHDFPKDIIVEVLRV